MIPEVSISSLHLLSKFFQLRNPVKLSLSQYASKVVGRKHFFSNVVIGKGDGKVVSILWGSLGANAINVAILHLYSEMFLHSTDLAYAAADLFISIAGAMICSEVLATGKPCILIMDIIDCLFVDMFNSLNEKNKKKLEAIENKYPSSSGVLMAL
ncbi:hypothetical protein FXO37_09986 [Capsicum annuum]|nr:hypothetical protein FXO37_09986 [Capsicum annuum]